MLLGTLHWHAKKNTGGRQTALQTERGVLTKNNVLILLIHHMIMMMMMMEMMECAWSVRGVACLV